MAAELRERVIALYREGFSPSMIAEKLSSENMTAGKVSYLLKKNGETRNHTHDRKRLNFYRDKDCVFCKSAFTPKSATQKYCKTCVPTHSASLRANNFGISQPEYDQMIRAQQNSCALCKRSFEGLSSLQIYVDHCHKNERVRGILCARCNTFLMVVDAPDFDTWLQKAKEYIMCEGLLPYWVR
jgi:hypothetical protein